MRVQKRVGVQRVRNNQAPGQEGFPNLSSKKFKDLLELFVQTQLADVRTVLTLQDKEVVPLLITKLRIHGVAHLRSMLRSARYDCGSDGGASK